MSSKPLASDGGGTHDGPVNTTSARRSRTTKVLLTLGLLLLLVRPSWASCSPPEISVDRLEVDAGDRIVVRGAAWADGCSAPREAGCGRDEQREPSALAGIDVSLVPKSGQRPPIPLGTIDADEDYGFELETVVPKSTPPGRYTLEARSGDTVNEPAVRVVIRG